VTGFLIHPCLHRATNKPPLCPLLDVDDFFTVLGAIAVAKLRSFQCPLADGTRASNFAVLPDADVAQVFGGGLHERGVYQSEAMATEARLERSPHCQRSVPFTLRGPRSLTIISRASRTSATRFSQALGRPGLFSELRGFVDSIIR